MFRPLLIAAALAGALATPPAVAESIAVKTGDLNLATSGGRTSLHHRVNSAARQLCISNGRQPLAIMARESECYRLAMASAQTQIAQLMERHPATAAS